MTDRRDDNAASPPPPMAKPQRVPASEPPQPKRKRSGTWLLTVVVALVVIAAAAVAIVLAVQHRSSPEESAESKIRTEIDTFVQALSSGNIQELRNNSCGPLADYYRGISDEQFAAVYKTAVEQKNVPVVQSVDAVQVSDKTAIAQVTAYTKADPQNRSARTFDLEETDQGWKVCDPPQ